MNFTKKRTSFSISQLLKQNLPIPSHPTLILLRVGKPKLFQFLSFRFTFQFFILVFQSVLVFSFCYFSFNFPSPDFCSSKSIPI